MAIDTAAKRRSVAGLRQQWAGAGVTPDATPGAEWRQQAARSYSGIAVAAPEVATFTPHGTGDNILVLDRPILNLERMIRFPLTNIRNVERPILVVSAGGSVPGGGSVPPAISSDYGSGEYGLAVYGG